MYKLIATDGEKSLTFEINQGSYTIGRSSDVEVSIPNRTISRKHATLELADGALYLTDLGSHNGTFINNQRISARTQITPGTEIHLGEVECQLLNASGPAPEKPGRSSILSTINPEHSVVLSINEALKPLPSRAAELPNLLPTIFEMARTLTIDEPQEQMFKRSLEMISRTLPADRLSILLRSDSEEHDQVYPAATHFPSKRHHGAFHISRTIVENILTEKNAILIGNLMDDPRFGRKESIIQSELTSAIAAPLFDQGTALGILYLDTSNPLHRYNDEHLRLVSAFANIIASRMLNYSLIDERRNKQALEAEMSRAAIIQRTLLSKDFPSQEGCQIYAYQEPSRMVGGDLYEVSQLNDNEALVLVADVSGKGMGAALLMTNILASFRTLTSSGSFDLLQAVQHVSLLLHKASESTDFATLFAAIVDLKKNELRYVNAGHNPPILRKKGGSLTELPATGIMIGAFPFGEWSLESTPFEYGDSLLVYTDGVTEAERENGDQYEEDRLREFTLANDVSSPRSFIEKLVADVRKFVGDSPQSDDITALMVTRN